MNALVAQSRIDATFEVDQKRQVRGWGVNHLNLQTLCVAFILNRCHHLRHGQDKSSCRPTTKCEKMMDRSKKKFLRFLLRIQHFFHTRAMKAALLTTKCYLKS